MIHTHPKQEYMKQFVIFYNIIISFDFSPFDYESRVERLFSFCGMRLNSNLIILNYMRIALRIIQKINTVPARFRP